MIFFNVVLNISPIGLRLLSRLLYFNRNDIWCNYIFLLESTIELLCWLFGFLLLTLILRSLRLSLRLLFKLRKLLIIYSPDFLLLFVKFNSFRRFCSLLNIFLRNFQLLNFVTLLYVWNIHIALIFVILMM